LKILIKYIANRQVPEEYFEVSENRI